jgi:hypothetical protein
MTNFLIGGKQRFSKSLISFKPRVGDFYVFPGWLLHGAEPFRGSGERRSLAFNAFVGVAEGWGARLEALSTPLEHFPEKWSPVFR